MTGNRTNFPKRFTASHNDGNNDVGREQACFSKEDGSSLHSLFNLATTSATSFPSFSSSSSCYYFSVLHLANQVCWQGPRDPKSSMTFPRQASEQLEQLRLSFEEKDSLSSVETRK
jgi:hypothetical protein